ncbi:hypothetical protein RvY_18225 [Ramazzottius varieornatus]|uniref:Uncharacterized protein n=1 Tax=Ramazzottius varieornatus TaxID=947166 RepID=A0A1D1W6P4_RAMVA|nr:hypothetical protein RvY_18225 [Ramazzottius varieornatus]
MSLPTAARKLRYALHCGNALPTKSSRIYPGAYDPQPKWQRNHPPLRTSRLSIHDLDVLDLVDSKNPYFGSRPSAFWEEITRTVNEAKIFKKPLDSRAVISRVNILVTAFRRDDLKNVKSGTEEQYGRIAELLTRVVAAIDDSKKQKDAKTQAETFKSKERDYAGEAVMVVGEKGRSGRRNKAADNLDDEAEKKEFLREMGGDEQDWGTEKDYRENKRAEADEKVEDGEIKPRKPRTSRPSRPSEMEVSDGKFIKLFKKTAERKYAFKEAESKRVYGLETKKLELREKELEIERFRIEMGSKKLYPPLEF